MIDGLVKPEFLIEIDLLVDLGSLEDWPSNTLPGLVDELDEVAAEVAQLEREGALASPVPVEDTPDVVETEGEDLDTRAESGVAPADAIVIGDSENDVLSARAAGCRVIVVQTGYNEGRSVSGLQADAIVPSLLDAARIIEAAEPE